MKKIILIFLILIMSLSIIGNVYSQRNTERTDKTDTDKTENRGRSMEMKQRFMEQKKNLMEKKEAFMNTKRDVKDVKDKIRELCKDNKENERCKLQKKQLKENAKPHLLRSAETMIKILENLKTRVENSDIEDKTAAIETINNKIAKINEIKSKIEAINESTTNVDIKAISKELREEWTSFNKSLKLHSQNVFNNRMSGILVKAEKLETKLDRMLNKLKEQGFDTSLVESDIQKFKENVKLARDNFDKAKAKYEEAKASGAREGTAIKESKDLLKTAHKNLQDAQHNLRDIIVKLKQSRQGQESLKDLTEDEDTETTTTTTIQGTTTTTVQETTTTLAQ